MKRIVILCDGTWNRSDSQHPTNVIRFAQHLRRGHPPRLTPYPREYIPS